MIEMWREDRWVSTTTEALVPRCLRSALDERVERIETALLATTVYEIS